MKNPLPNANGKKQLPFLVYANVCAPTNYRKNCIKRIICRMSLWLHLSIALAILPGCALVLIGAAGCGAMVAADRRTLGAQTEDREIQIKAAARLAAQLPDEAHV